MSISELYNILKEIPIDNLGTVSFNFINKNNEFKITIDYTTGYIRYAGTNKDLQLTNSGRSTLKWLQEVVTRGYNTLYADYYG